MNELKIYFGNDSIFTLSSPLECFPTRKRGREKKSQHKCWTFVNTQLCGAQTQSTKKDFQISAVTPCERRDILFKNLKMRSVNKSRLRRFVAYTIPDTNK